MTLGSHDTWFLFVFLQAELKGYSPDNYSRINEMKERSEALRSHREEERKQIANEKLYQHFRQNSPDIRKVTVY